MSLLATGGLLVILPLYLRGVRRAEIRPRPLSWGIWSVLGVIGAASATAGGAGWAALPAQLTAVISTLVFVLALRGKSAAEPSTQLWLLVPAAAGIVLWSTSGSPVAAALGVVVADLAALVPTVRGTWRDPESEPAHLWALSGVAYLLALVPIPEASPAAWLYPAYLAFASFAVASTAWAARRAATLVSDSPS